MYKRKNDIVFLSAIIGLHWAVSFPLNSWFSETMPRHQLLQLPAMLILGIVAGWQFSKRIRPGISGSISIFIVVMASLIFWMLPHSIDRSVISPAFNRLMHINIFGVGFFCIPAIRNLILELRVLFLGMIAAMFIAAGYTLTSYDTLLCSSFDIIQQQETGAKLIIIGASLFALNLFVFFRGLGRT